MSCMLGRRPLISATPAARAALTRPRMRPGHSSPRAVSADSTPERRAVVVGVAADQDGWRRHGVEVDTGVFSHKEALFARGSLPFFGRRFRERPVMVDQTRCAEGG